MSLLDTNSDELIAAAEQAPPPMQRKEPPKRFSTWGMFSAAPKGVAAGAAEATGSTADILGAFGQALATTGGSGKGMFATPTPEERKQTNEATDKLLKDGIDYNSEAGRAFRNVSADYTPDPQTAHVAESAVFNLFRVGSKALTSAATMGNIPGAVVAGLEEGFTQSDQLGQQGVDLATRSKVGAVTALTNAVGFALPVAGATWKSTAALAVAGGPASFIAQNAATREILQAADYSKLADQYDPLDPVGLALSTLLPLGFGAFAMRRAKVKPGVEDKGPMPDGTSPDIKAPAPADTAQPATKGIANVQDAQAPAGTKAQATPDQAGTNAAGNAAPPTDVPGTGAADVQANGVAPKQGPGAPLANGYFAGPVEGEKFRVSDVSATGGLTLDKRLSGGTVSTMYVGVDGGFVDAENVNLLGDGVARLWKPLTDLARQAAREILQEMGTLPLGNKRREELKAKLKEVVANDGKPPPDTAPPKMAPPDDLVDAARVNLVREHMDATNPKPGDLEAADAHSKAYKQAMEQQAEGRPVSIMDVAPKIEPIAGKATDTPNFKAWFGESKVVDDTGAPMVLYHGTGGNFDEISPSAGTANSDAGFYVSPSPSEAGKYAAFSEGSPNIVPVFASIKNPYFALTKSEISTGENGQMTVKDWGKLRAAGFDGVAIGITKDEFLSGARKLSDASELAVLNGRQIKSAIGNSGKFDPNSGSLTDNPIADWGAGLTKALDDMAKGIDLIEAARIRKSAEVMRSRGMPDIAARYENMAISHELKAKRDSALADAAQAATKTSVELTVKPETNFMQAKTDAGIVGGHIRDGALHITTAEVDQAMRGQGEGVRLYMAIVDDALSKGLRVFSDSTVEASAVRMYEALQRRGYEVKRLEGGSLEDGAAYGKGAKEPAFEVVGKTESKPAPALADTAQAATKTIAQREPASWVIRNKETGEVIMETFDKKKVAALNTSKYEAVPVLDYLVSINGQAKAPPDATAKPTDSGQPVSAGEASLDARLADISYRNPTALDAEIAVAFDDKGKPTSTMTAREYLDKVKQEAASDVKDASLFEVAANCFLSGGA